MSRKPVVNQSALSGSPAEIQITGGDVVPFSNIKVTFGGAAAGHFGTQSLDGVVTSAR